ncbi:MAG: hypothetical protein H0X52_05520, partial [Gemmatimonadetes bacterium]|nr:hypothetical protein [Gemmatimonadota bacterium]
GNTAAIHRVYPLQVSTLTEQCKRLPGKVVHTQSVIEAGVGGTGIHQVCQPELPDVPEALELGRVNDLERRGIQSYGVPQRITDDFEIVG